MGQYLVKQYGGSLCNTTCPATGTEAAALATECDQILLMAAVVLHPQKGMLKTDIKMSLRLRYHDSAYLTGCAQKRNR
jgi:hypothetical protein